MDCWSPDFEQGLNCAGLEPMEVLSRQQGATESIEPDTEAKIPGGQVKEDEELTDVLSTGRKRAAQLFPLEEGMICEWAGLLNAGADMTYRWLRWKASLCPSPRTR